jgi:hypothetical protein
MTAAEFRRIALKLNGASEGAHMGHPDFRANGRIFATLQPDGITGMVKLSPEQQADYLASDPTTFRAASGAWGRQGCTLVSLESADEDQLGEAMTLAWQLVMQAAKSKTKGTTKGTKRSKK